MKIAINCAFLQLKGGGTKEYVSNLVNNLIVEDHANTYVCYCFQDNVDYARQFLPEGVKIKKIPFNSASKKDVIKRSLFENRFWRKEEKEEKFDLFHSPFFYGPNLKNTPVIITLHDLRVYRYPKSFDFMRYRFLIRKVKKSLQSAAHIISVSQFTKNEAIDICGIDSDKITVIHEGINPARFKKNDSANEPEISKVLTGPFLLAVGHMEPRKNYDRLISAFNRIRQSGRYPDLKLVIVGKKDHGYDKTLQMIDQNPDIIYLNFVDHDTLLWLYGHTALHVFPSFYEGFGFPPLEAAMQGTVSAVSNVSSIPEVCGDTAYYFDPFDEESISRAIMKGLEKGDDYNAMKARLPEHLNKFSWRNNALQTIRIYNEMS